MKKKRCVTCIEDKPLSEFNKQSSQKDGYAFYCRICRNKQKKADYERDKDLILPRIKEKREANIEKTRSDNRASYWRNVDQRRLDAVEYSRKNKTVLSGKNKARYLANPEFYKDRERQKREADPELARERGRASYRRNKAKYVARARKREIELTNATPPWVDMKEITKFYIEAERLTLETGIPHEVDHKFPLKGKNSCGLHVPWNLQILTRVANRRKSNSIPTQEDHLDGTIEEAEGRACAA